MSRAGAVVASDSTTTKSQTSGNRFRMAASESYN
jgi:hypothetical protein